MTTPTEQPIGTLLPSGKIMTLNERELQELHDLKEKLVSACNPSPKLPELVAKETLGNTVTFKGGGISNIAPNVLSYTSSSVLSRERAIAQRLREIYNWYGDDYDIAETEMRKLIAELEANK